MGALTGTQLSSQSCHNWGEVERGEGGEGVMMVIEEEGVSRDGIQKLIITIKSACMKFQLLKLRLVHESV